MVNKRVRKSAWIKGFSAGYEGGFAAGYRAGMAAGRVQGKPEGVEVSKVKVKRGVREARVVRKEKIAPNIMRVCANSADLVGLKMTKTDSYLKIFHVPAGADYQWPFDFSQVRRTVAKHLRPVTRTVTVRRLDPETGDFWLDLVLRGDKGVASSWALTVKPGDEFGFIGPKGKWSPRADLEHFVLAGDECASAAIAAGVEQIPAGATAVAFIEVAARGYEIALPEKEGVETHFVYRNGGLPGQALAQALRDYQPPAKKAGWFVRGSAGMVKEIRHYILSDLGADKRDVSVSSYWRWKKD